MNLDAFTLSDRSQEAAVEDLEARRVDAIFVWEPYATRAQDAVKGNRLFSTADFPGLTYTVLTLPRAFVTSRGADVEVLLRVWDRATRFIRENPGEACAIIAKTYNVPASAPGALMLTDRILDIADNTRAFSYAAGFESLHGSWRRMNDFMLNHGLVRTQMMSTEHLDSRFISAVD